MSLTQVRNVVLLFSNPVWSGANTVPTTIIRNVTALSSQFAYQNTVTQNLTTLTITNADTLNGVIQGLLYVPDIPFGHPCYEQQYELIPHNVTRQAQLPPTNINLIALAPWFNATCTLAYLAAARMDPIRAFIFYRPNNSTNKPQSVDKLIWDLDDGGAWQTENHFPIFAIPGRTGAELMDALGRYSGNLSQVPFGREIMNGLEPNPRDYVRIWTELTMRDPDNIPAMWTYFLIVVGATLFLIACISIMMHLVQRRRRNRLRRRIVKGEVDLEALGIKRLTVPVDHVRGFPLFTYSWEPEMSSVPPTPSSPRSPRSPRTPQKALSSPTSRSHRASISAGSISTEATNFQPSCHICLDMFEHRSSVIRELPCQHIFHPECIDEYLSQNSSLCPICRRSMLPRGFCPRITNGIVRRERAIRRLQARVLVDDSDSDKAKRKTWGRRLLGGPQIFGDMLPTSQSIVETPRIPATPRTPRTPTTATVMSTPPQPTMETVPELPPSQEAQPSPPTQTPLVSETPDLTAQSTVAEPSQTPPPGFRSVEPPSTPQPLTIDTIQAVRAAQTVSSAPDGPSPEGQPQSPTTPKRSRRRRPRALQLQAPPPEAVLVAQRTNGRRTSDKTRQRMRHLAGSQFEDEERRRRPLWGRILIKVFPGFS